MSYVDIQRRPSTLRVWDVRSMLSAVWRLAGRLCARDSAMPSLSAQWCEQYERESIKH